MKALGILNSVHFLKVGHIVLVNKDTLIFFDHIILGNFSICTLLIWGKCFSNKIFKHKGDFIIN